MKLQLWTALTAGRWRGRRDPVTGEEDEIRSPERKTRSGHPVAGREEEIRSYGRRRGRRDPVAREEDKIRSPERKTRSGRRRGRRHPVIRLPERKTRSGHTVAGEEDEIRSPEKKTRSGRNSNTSRDKRSLTAAQQKGGAFNCRDDEKDETPTTVVTPGGTPTAPTY
jgi:hypothetical protein